MFLPMRKSAGLPFGLLSVEIMLAMHDRCGSLPDTLKLHKHPLLRETLIGYAFP